MSTQGTRYRLEFRPGTRDALMLRTLILGWPRGKATAYAVRETSQEELLAEHGALYPALQRREERSISAKWGGSSNNRKASVRIPGPEAKS